MITLSFRRTHIYNTDMTQIVAIPCKDRIVVSGDGKMYDTETKKYSNDMPKLFKLTDSICLMLTGNLMKEPGILIPLLVAEAEDAEITSFNKITDYISNYLKRKNPLKREVYIWQDEKSTEKELAKSSISFIVAGYDGNTPKVCVISSNFEGLHPRTRYTLGAWTTEGLEHLEKTFKKRTYKKIRYQDAELEAITIIMNAEKAEPKIVGGKGQLWHIRRQSVPDEKSSTYIKSLRERVHL